MTRAEVQRALWEDRTLVKTFGPRGTVHLLAAADLPVDGGPRPCRRRRRIPERVRFTAERDRRGLAAMGSVLAEAELTVDELTEALAGPAGPWAVERMMPAFQDLWPRWRQVTSRAAYAGVLCFGPDRGRKVTYTNPHRWRPGFRPEAARRRRRARRAVPARLRPGDAPDFGPWLAIPPAGRPSCSTDGPRPWCAWSWKARRPGPGGRHGDDGRPPGRSGCCRTSTRTSSAGSPRLLFPGARGTRALMPSGQAGNYPVLLVDGVVAGVWHQRRSGRRVAITVEPLHRLSARSAASSTTRSPAWERSWTPRRP